MTRKIYMELMGGIGNQLFQYFAGIEIAKINNADIKFVEVRAELHEKSHKLSGLFNLIDPNLIVKKVPHSILNFNSVNKIFFLFARKNSCFRKFMFRFGFVFESNELISAEFRLKRRTNYLKGYFQTYKYFDELSLAERDLDLRNRSDWFQEIEEMIRNDKCLAVHIRRGDYVHHTETLGLLAEDYYSRAIRRAFKENQYNRVMVFSDSIKVAISLVENLNIQNVYYINPPERSPAAESLMLMSFCQGIVLGNSTFSYWAASLGATEKKVYFPNPWAISKDYPVPITPPGWIPIEADFEF